MSWYSAWFVCCCESLPQEKPPNNQATQRPPNQSSHEKLPKSSLTAAFEDRDWQMMKGDPPLGWGFCWDLVKFWWTRLLEWLWNSIQVERRIGCSNSEADVSLVFLGRKQLLFLGSSYGSSLSFCVSGAWKRTIWYVLFDFQGIMSCWTTVQEDCLSWYWKMLYLARVFLPSKG